MEHCKDVLGMVRYCNARIAEKWNAGELKDTETELFELDIKSMFPSLSREGVWDALQDLHDAVLRGRRANRGRGHELRFAIKKLDRKLDRTGSAAPECYTNVRFTDVNDFLRFDIFHNDIFVIGNAIYEQIKGIAIGGTISASCANAFCLMREHHFYSHVLPFAPEGPQAIHPCELPGQPARFRDNNMGVKYRSASVQTLQNSFEEMYDLKLQYEGGGDTWTFLQAQVTVVPAERCQDTGMTTAPPYLRLSLADKGQKYHTEHHRLRRFPDWYSGKAKRTLRSLTPAMAKNCAYYRDTKQDAMHNMQQAFSDLQNKGYPESWWKHKLYQRLAQWGLPVQEWRETR